MKAYSHALRERVAAACAEPGAKIYQVAARFSVSLSFTDKLLRRQRTSGSVAELPRHPGPAPRLDAAGDQCLLTCLRARLDATLAEIGQALVAAGGPSLQRTAVWKAVERLGWGRKKSVHAAERDTKRVVALRRLFVEAMQEEDVARFVFVDETSTNLTSCRRYGRAPAGRRLDQAACRCTAARTGRSSPRSPPMASGRGCAGMEPSTAMCLPPTSTRCSVPPYDRATWWCSTICRCIKWTTCTKSCKIRRALALSAAFLAGL